MISKKELEYVNSWARKVPYPGTEYSEMAMENLKRIFVMFNELYKNKSYNIVFSNGVENQFEIFDKNLAHLVGVDYKNLVRDDNKEWKEKVLGVEETYSFTAYDLIKLMIENSEKVLSYDYDERRDNGNRALNSYKINVKCAIFEKLSDFSKFNFGCINFDKDVFESFGNTTMSNATHYFYVPSNELEAPYFMMGIKKDSNSDIFIPETLVAVQNGKDYFNSQEVVIPTQIIISADELTKITASPSEKLALLNMYKSIVLEYGIQNKMNINGDYASMLAEQENLLKFKKTN